ncbi:prepilin peptidase [Paenibacillus dendritiformis]|uniref:prepilin peptidase n=1 Tax=Paenibacillus dendritiformis TaxID=130049 RepID=UPI0018CEA74F|nr:prepilin peptidase [Paenibacillus dendritiformis]
MGNFMLWGPLFIILGIATYTDLKWRIIPDKLVLAGLIYFLLLRMFYADQSYIYYLLGIATGAGLLYIMALIVRESFGGGDIKLMAVVGVALGWQLAFIFLIFVLVGAFLYALLFIRRSKGIKMPLAPFFLVSAVFLHVPI